MSLTEAERATIDRAGESGDQNIRGQAVAIVLSKDGASRENGRRLLAQSYVRATSPSFHFIPRGDAMLASPTFEEAYAIVQHATAGFTNVSVDSLRDALLTSPAALAPLRMIAGVTYNELSYALRATGGAPVSGARLRSFERDADPRDSDPRKQERRAELATQIAETLMRVVQRTVLEVPASASASFHSKLDKRDTEHGWISVAEDAEHGVPYHALLYQRYVGGLWRQVQDAYSEVKGDAILELPLEALLRERRVPFWRSPRGATGARATAHRYGIDPGPDFLIPDENPTVIVESKVAEDGGTVRDKAARIQRLAGVAAQRGLLLCAVVAGKGWSERLSALADVVIATNGRTFSLATIEHLLEVPEVAVWVGRGT